MNLSENNIVPISTNDKSYVNSCEGKDKTKKKINNKNCCILILLHELGILAFFNSLFVKGEVEKKNKSLPPHT